MIIDAYDSGSGKTPENFTQVPPNGCELFGNCILREFDLYWICYESEKLNKDVRQELKSLGWRLQKHSRTNKEMWVFDKGV